MIKSDAADRLTVGLAQIAPVWLKREPTLNKILEYVDNAAEQSCDLVVFGEGLLPGYPFWIERTNGAEFNSPRQKEMHAYFLANAVQIEAGRLDQLCETAADRRIAPAPTNNYPNRCW